MTETEVSFTDVPEESPVKAALELGRVLKENARLLTQITNTLAKDKEIEDRWQLQSPCVSRNLANSVEDEVVDAGR